MISRSFNYVLLAAAAAAATIAGPLQAQETVYPIAVLPFTERGRDVETLGNKVSDLLFANLVVNPNIYLVERETLSNVLEEQELGESGLVSPAEATQLGQLTGAKIVISGSVLQVGEKLYVVAKLIGAESTRVLGTSVKGKFEEDLDDLVEELAGKVSATVAERSDDLVPKPLRKTDRVASLKQKLGEGRRPSVFIEVAERHVGQVNVDPAAQTELAYLCKELGFQVIDPDVGSKSDAELLLVGEGFSQFAARHGNLTSVKARLEIKAVEPESGSVVAVDRETTIGVGLAEQIAGKSALEDAAGRIATRLLPKLVRD